MRHNIITRSLALALALVMVLGLGVTGVQAAPAKQNVTFEKLDSIVLEGEAAIGKVQPGESFLANADAVAYRAELQAKQDKVASAISQQALKGKELDVVWNLTLVSNAISANVAYGDIQKIAGVEGVERVYLETVYHPQTAEKNNIVAQEMTGANVAQNSYGYYGAGTAVAVVDTGTDPDHQSFSAEGFEYALAQNAAEAGMELDAYMESLGLIDADHIAKVLPHLNVGKRFPGLTAEELYGNTKMPFNFNYVDGDLNVSHDFDDMGSHGSHVAGIAAANRFISVDKLCDLNGDGKASLEDAQVLMDHVILGSEAENLYTADLNTDGQVDEQDVTALLDALDAGYYAEAAELVGVTGVAPDA